jgi:hypothetical protein
MTSEKWKKTDYGYIQEDIKKFDDEWFGVEPVAAMEWSEWLMEAISDMKKFGVKQHWDFFNPAVRGLVHLANRVGIDSSIAAIGYHVQIVSPNASFVKILIFKDGNPSPLQIIFYNEDKLIGIISPIGLPQYFNKQTHRRKGAKKLPFALRKFPHTELLEASSFIDKAINRFVDSDKLQ